MTTKQVMQRLRVSRCLLQRLIKAGKLKGQKVGNRWQFDEQAVLSCIVEQATIDNKPNHIMTRRVAQESLLASSCAIDTTLYQEATSCALRALTIGIPDLDGGKP